MLVPAHEARAGLPLADRVVTGDPDRGVDVWVESTWCGTRREMLTADGRVHVHGQPPIPESRYYEGGDPHAWPAARS